MILKLVPVCVCVCVLVMVSSCSFLNSFFSCYFLFKKMTHWLGLPFFLNLCMAIDFSLYIKFLQNLFCYCACLPARFVGFSLKTEKSARTLTLFLTQIYLNLFFLFVLKLLVTTLLLFFFFLLLF